MTQNPYIRMAERLKSAGHPEAAARVRALAIIKPKPGEIPPLARALLGPDVTDAENVVIDIATQIVRLADGLTTQPDGGQAVATAVCALAMAQRTMELRAASAQLDDGATLPNLEVDAWNVKGIELAERLAKMTKIVLGEEGKPGLITDSNG